MDPASIAKCWTHSKCLPINDDFHEDGERIDLTNIRREIHEMFSSLDISKLPSVDNDSAQSNNNPVCACLMRTAQVFRTEGEISGARMVQRWIDLEDDPEIMVADTVLLANEVEDSLDSSTDFNTPNDATTSSTEIVPVVQSLFDSVNQALSDPICESDPTLSNLLQQLKLHLTATY